MRLPQQLHALDDRSQVGAVRRAAAELAARLRFDAERAGRLALAATEVATNVLKHASRGELLLRVLVHGDAYGVEILALDAGPGIVDTRAALRDGHSTAGSLGAGLGALSRVCDAFDLFTLPGRGTAVRLELWAEPSSRTRGSIELGAVCTAKPGEHVSGDSWSVEVLHDDFSVLVVDGLGHGTEAARASSAAVAALKANAGKRPAEILHACHYALAATRGAAVSVALVSPRQQRGVYAGVGNVVCRVDGSGARRQLVSHNGILGHRIRKIQEFEFTFPREALLVLHSDGLSTRWDLADYPGLVTHHPGVIAGVLYRDHQRARDDATVVVLRNSAPH